MNDERLAFILRAPALVERAVRGALREALRSRRYRSGALEVRAFANAALGELERIAEGKRIDLDALARLELKNATVAAAGCFASSAAARRLFALPVGRLRAAPAECDAALLDARGCSHVVRLELVASGAARAELAAKIGRALPRPKGNEKENEVAARVHLLSLRDGKLRSFGAAEGAAEDRRYA